MMIIDELFNRFHDWCETDSAYKSWLFLLIKCQVHKCLGSKHVDCGLHAYNVTLFVCEGERRVFVLYRGPLSGGLLSGIWSGG